MILLESEAPNDDHWLSLVTDPSKEEYDPDIGKWELSTYENWANLPKAYTGSLESMPNAWKKKYLFGRTGFIPDGKPFYDGFSEKLHVGEFEFNPNRQLVLGWDFGYHHPCLIVSQMDSHDRWLILKVYLGHDITIDKFADSMTAALNQDFPDGKFSNLNFGDPACKQVNDKSEDTSWKIMCSKGYLVYYRTSEYRLRKEIIESKLSKIIHGKPALMVDRRCTIVIDGFLGGYHYPLRKPGQEAKIRFEAPFKDGYYEHPMNALEYIAVNSFSPIQRVRRNMPKEKKPAITDNI